MFPDKKGTNLYYLAKSPMEMKGIGPTGGGGGGAQLWYQPLDPSINGFSHPLYSYNLFTIRKLQVE